jgi:ribosomal protein S10
MRKWPIGIIGNKEHKMSFTKASVFLHRRELEVWEMTTLLRDTTSIPSNPTQKIREHVLPKCRYQATIIHSVTIHKISLNSYHCENLRTYKRKWHLLTWDFHDVQYW